MSSKLNKYISKSLESIRSFISSPSTDSDNIVPLKYLQKLDQYNIKLSADSIIIESYEVALKSKISPSLLNNLLTIFLLSYDSINVKGRLGRFVSSIYVDLLITLIISSCKNENVDENSLKLYADVVNSKFIKHMNKSYNFPLATKICPIHCPILTVVKLLNRKNKHHNYVQFLGTQISSNKNNENINHKLKHLYGGALRLNYIPTINKFNNFLLNKMLGVNQFGGVGDFNGLHYVSKDDNTYIVVDFRERTRQTIANKINPDNFFLDKNAFKEYILDIIGQDISNSKDEYNWKLMNDTLSDRISDVEEGTIIDIDDRLIQSILNIYGESFYTESNFENVVVAIKLLEDDYVKEYYQEKKQSTDNKVKEERISGFIQNIENFLKFNNTTLFDGMISLENSNLVNDYNLITPIKFRELVNANKTLTDTDDTDAKTFGTLKKNVKTAYDTLIQNPLIKQFIEEHRDKSSSTAAAAAITDPTLMESFVSESDDLPDFENTDSELDDPLSSPKGEKEETKDDSNIGFEQQQIDANTKLNLILTQWKQKLTAYTPIYDLLKIRFDKINKIKSILDKETEPKLDKSVVLDEVFQMTTEESDILNKLDQSPNDAYISSLAMLKQAMLKQVDSKEATALIKQMLEQTPKMKSYTDNIKEAIAALQYHLSSGYKSSIKLVRESTGYMAIKFMSADNNIKYLIGGYATELGDTQVDNAKLLEILKLLVYSDKEQTYVVDDISIFLDNPNIVSVSESIIDTITNLFPSTLSFETVIKQEVTEQKEEQAAAKKKIDDVQAAVAAAKKQYDYAQTAATNAAHQAKTTKEEQEKAQAAAKDATKNAEELQEKATKAVAAAKTQMDTAQGDIKLEEASTAAVATAKQLQEEAKLAAFFAAEKQKAAQAAATIAQTAADNASLLDEKAELAAINVSEKEAAEKERLEKEAAEKEAAEKERLEKEAAEKERLAREVAAKKQKEAEEEAEASIVGEIKVLTSNVITQIKTNKGISELYTKTIAEKMVSNKVPIEELLSSVSNISEIDLKEINFFALDNKPNSSAGSSINKPELVAVFDELLTNGVNHDESHIILTTAIGSIAEKLRNKEELRELVEQAHVILKIKQDKKLERFEGPLTKATSNLIMKAVELTNKKSPLGE